MSEDMFVHAAQHYEQKTFDEFVQAVRDLLEGAASRKSYNKTGVDGPNDLYDFVHSIAGDGHALGEIIYKVKRFDAKHDPVDIIKVAAWAFLIWRKAMKNGG